MINDPWKHIDDLNRFHSGAPINFHMETMFSNIKIGDLDFLSLYNQCMIDTNQSAPSWKTFRRAQRALILGKYFDYLLSIPGRKLSVEFCKDFQRYSQIKSLRCATKSGLVKTTT